MQIGVPGHRALHMIDFAAAGSTACRKPAEAADIFGDDAPIVDGDAMRDLGSVHAAGSMVRVAPNGELSRSGSPG